MTRRSFLQTAAKAALTMGLGSVFPSMHRAAAAPQDILHLRQIITAKPMQSRMIQWDSPALLSDVRIEVRAANTSEIYSAAPAYTYFVMDGTEQYIYHAEIPISMQGGTYRVQHAGGSSPWIPLPASLPDSQEPLSMLIFSDSQCGESYDVWHTVYHAAWQRHPLTDAVAIVGDLTDNGESQWHWNSFFDAMEGADSPLAHIVHVPVLGNHEYYDLNWHAAPPTRYLNTFALPENGSDSFRGHYYSFDLGSVHFIVLDTQFFELGVRGEELKTKQLRWFIQDATASAAPWRIVLMHKDILSYGDYQPEQQIDTGISDVGRVFLDVFDSLAIDLVISGHIHTYRRRQIRFGQRDPHGTLYLLAGPAGNQSFHVPPEIYDEYAAVQPIPSNYLYLEAAPERLRIICETVQGEVLDALDYTKDHRATIYG